jgi:hypothetical protein
MTVTRTSALLRTRRWNRWAVPATVSSMFGDLHHGGDAVHQVDGIRQRLVNHRPIRLDELPGGIGAGRDEGGRHRKPGLDRRGEAGRFELGVPDAVRVVDVQAAGQGRQNPTQSVPGLRDGEPGVLLAEVREGEAGRPAVVERADVRQIGGPGRRDEATVQAALVDFGLDRQCCGEVSGVEPHNRDGPVAQLADHHVGGGVVQAGDDQHR